MTNDNSNNPAGNKIYVDLFWYLIGSVIPAVIALIRVPVFTRYFTPGEYGYYSLVTSTFAYISMVLFSWLSSCLWRFYIQAEKNNTLNVLYSNLLLLAFFSFLLMMAITVTWLFLVNSTLVYRLVALSFLQLTTGQALSIYLVTMRIKGRALFYNLIYSIQAVAAFALLFYFAFSLDLRIESILLGQVIINVILILVILISLKKLPKLSLKYVTAKAIRELLKYGAVGLYTSFCVLLLISSDRYIIALFSDIGSVGIYNQVYMLGQFSIYHLVTVYFNTINPQLMKLLTNKPPGLKVQVTGYIHFFILIIFPLVFYFSIFSRQMADVLLGEKFRSGYRMIPFIMLSSFIYGLTLFNEARLKFENRFSSLITGMTIATLTNIGLNFILIPLRGYQTAAITTLISYSILFLWFYYADTIRYLDFNLFGKFLPAIVILVSQLIIDQLLRNVFQININEWYTIFEGIVFLTTYLFINRKYTRKLVILFKDQRSG